MDFLKQDFFKMQQRITLDWDFKFSIFKILGLSSIAFYKNTEVILLKPSIKKGYHVIVWLKKPVTNEKHFYLRNKWHDDKNRIRLDKERLRRNEPINILFNEKYDLYYKRK